MGSMNLAMFGFGYVVGAVVSLIVTVLLMDNPKRR